MLYKYQGDTIRWNVVIKDFDGTSLNTETPQLYFEDSTGSNIFSEYGTFVSDGSYYAQANIGANWGTGPGKYWWNVVGPQGTSREVYTNEILILSGTGELPAYAYEAELPNYYANITDFNMQNASYKLTERYHYINRLLKSLNIKAPRGKNEDNQYDYSLRAMNANYAIYDIIGEDDADRGGSGEKPWYTKFKDDADSIYDDIKKKKIVFRDQVSAADAGIGKPSRTAGTSIGTMFTNWDRSYGQGFRGADFDRTWRVEIIGTGTTGAVNEGYFRWTNDTGITWGTISISFGWMHLDDEVYVRFEGSGTGTTGILEVGDKWSFDTKPIKRQVGGYRVVKSY